MKASTMRSQFLLLLLAVSAPAYAADPSERQEAAIAEIEKLATFCDSVICTFAEE